MIVKIFAWALMISVIFQSAFSQGTAYKRQFSNAKKQHVVINLTLSQDYLKRNSVANGDSIQLLVASLFRAGFDNQWNKVKASVNNNKVKWEFDATEPMQINSKFLDGLILISPGDNINVVLDNKGCSYSGKGAVKGNLWNRILNDKDQYAAKPNLKKSTNPLEDYLKWSKSEDKRLDKSVKLIDSCKRLLTPLEYDYLRSYLVHAIEGTREIWFGNLHARSVLDSTVKISREKLCTIWDSAQNNPYRKWLLSLSEYYGPVIGFYYINRGEVRRRFDIDISKDSITNKEKRTFLYYINAKRNYKGLLREKLMAYILNEPTIIEMGLQNDMTQLMLADYYNQPGFSEYKAWVKMREEIYTKLHSGKGAPDFQLTDLKGNVFTKENLKGKIALLDFWFTGCQPCIEMAKNLQKVENVFRQDTDVVFVSISTDADKNRWMNSVASGKYTVPNAISVYTSGQGKMHDILKYYTVSGYPELHLLNAKGQIVQFPLPKPSDGKGLQELISIIKREQEKREMSEVASANDGPYVLYENNSLLNYYVTNSQVVTKEISRSNPIVEVSTDKKKKTFQVILKSELENEPSEYDQPKKLFALSDIEGNFDAFSKLLQRNGVVNGNFEWTYGNGHLVLVGDMFDRGEQVTECLWLIYSLEEKAKQAGGYVHYILGNHELMNLSGNNKYATKKYKDNSLLIGKSLEELYGPNSELGRWLRTKNIVEKIGDLLFVHGGISSEMNQLHLSIGDINMMAKKWYGSRSQTFANNPLNIIMSSTVGPFWFRGYYKGQSRNVYNEIDDVLKQYQIDHIITGHTIVKDTISIHYDGKVINTDTKHAQGFSEALLVDDKSYYRVTADGQKVHLFDQKVFPLKSVSR